jgi:carboxylesterase type B
VTPLAVITGRVTLLYLLIKFRLLDQRVALEWINAHICSFGGNPRDITIFGNSSGAGIIDILLPAALPANDPSVSCDAHLQSISTLLFKRAILQSGACVGATKPLEIDHEYHRSTFDRLVGALSLNPSIDVIETLRTRPSQDLITAMATVENPDGMFCITADHDLTDGFWKVSNEPSESRDLVIGNTRHDVVVFLVATADCLGICLL